MLRISIESLSWIMFLFLGGFGFSLIEKCRTLFVKVDCLMLYFLFWPGLTLKIGLFFEKEFGVWFEISFIKNDFFFVLSG